MDSQSSKKRGARPAIAVVAALGLFVALIGGFALRPQYAAAQLPEPSVWTHAGHGVQAHVSHVPQAVTGQARETGHASAPATKKPFHSMWMTRDLPTTSTDVSPQVPRLALPVSFTASESLLGRTRWGESAAAPVNRDISTQLCVVRC
jgi:hypothetical protein